MTSRRWPALLVGMMALLLGSGCSPKRIAPVTERQSGFLIYRANAYRVLLFAIAATPQKPLVPLSGFRVQHLVGIHTPTIHTARSVTPTLLFQKLHRRRFIGASYWDGAYNCRFRETVLSVIALCCHANNLIHSATCVKYKNIDLEKTIKLIGV